MSRSAVLQRSAGLVAAVVFAAGAVWAAQRSPEPRPEQAAPATTTPSTGPTATPTESLPGSVATAGPGLTEPGVHVVAQPDATGALEVVERVRTAAPVRALSLALPQASVPGMAGVTPSLSGFQADAGGLVVSDTPVAPLTSVGDRLELPAPASEITMRYRLTGASSRSQPAPAGRVLVVLPPLTQPDPGVGDPPVVVEVSGGTVRNLVCSDLAATDQLCGRQQGRVWSTTTLSLSRSTVVAQLDLPDPGGS
ncbi:MAG TPA: hypothetical protein VFR40_17065 [Lapillicoccus sp.]|nr:hypothetical protein [Lapillicoccus sp.]